MSRSIGARSLTRCVPILMSPDEISSRPAIILSVVGLPQPDGPTKTMNSRSRMSRFTSFTAWTQPSQNLLTWERTPCAIAPALRSAFDRAGEPGDVMLDEERVGD